MDGVVLNYEVPHIKNTYWMVTIIIDRKFGLTKEELMALLDKHNIDTRPFFYPLSYLPAYQHLEQARQARERNKVSYAISPYGINLPSALNLTQEDIKYVCKTLKSILNSS